MVKYGADEEFMSHMFAVRARMFKTCVLLPRLVLLWLLSSFSLLVLLP